VWASLATALAAKNPVCHRPLSYARALDPGPLLDGCDHPLVEFDKLDAFLRQTLKVRRNKDDIFGMEPKVRFAQMHHRRAQRCSHNDKHQRESHLYRNKDPSE
jgi:hypothetical protein